MAKSADEAADTGATGATGAKTGATGATGAPDDDVGAEPVPERLPAPKTVTVHCGIPNGFILSFMGKPDQLTGQGLTIPTDVHERFQIPLKAGPNPGISAAKWKIWLDENGLFSAVVSGHIFATED